MNKIAIFPGSFDPITKGHEDIVLRALPLFDKIFIGIGNNPEKKFLFPLQKRENWIKSIFSEQSKISVVTYTGLTVDFCKKNGINFIIRGLRSQSDFEFEKNIAQMNNAMAPDIETIFMLCKPQYSAVSSSIVRDIIVNGGNVSQFLPEGMIL